MPLERLDLGQIAQKVPMLLKSPLEAFHRIVAESHITIILGADVTGHLSRRQKVELLHRVVDAVEPAKGVTKGQVGLSLADEPMSQLHTDETVATNTVTQEHQDSKAPITKRSQVVRSDDQALNGVSTVEPLMGRRHVRVVGTDAVAEPGHKH